MAQNKSLRYRSAGMGNCLVVAGSLALLCSLPAYIGGSLWYGETKGPFKNSTQVVDMDGDGSPDVLVSHTRWEEVDLSWAGIGRWMNRGDGTFELLRDTGTEIVAGFAAAAGDVDQDGDADIYVHEFQVRFLQNQGGEQGRQTGTFRSNGSITTPNVYYNGYRDMGGTITMGDLTGDGRLDAFVAGCCYGMDPGVPGDNSFNEPSVSWVWINQGKNGYYPTGQPLALDFLKGQPIREAAFGDVDGDGDLDVAAALAEPTMGTSGSPGGMILLNDGKGDLTALDQRLDDTDSTSVALGDVDGDGDLDVLVGTDTGAGLWINRGSSEESGGPLFVPAEQSFAARKTPWTWLQVGISAAAARLAGLYLPYGSTRTKAVFLADLDSDGDPDALLGRMWGAEIWWNDGQGEFQRSNLRFAYPEDTGLAIADFDGDGDQDIFSGRNEPEYQVWWNHGKGVFRPWQGRR